MAATEDFPVRFYNGAQCVIPWVMISDEKEAVFFIFIGFLLNLPSYVYWDGFRFPVPVV